MFFALIGDIAAVLGGLAVLWIAWIAFLRWKNTRAIRVRTVPQSQPIGEFAKQSAINQGALRQNGPFDWPIPRMNANYEAILATYKELNDAIARREIVPDTAEWLLDNFYIIEERVKVIRRDADRRYFKMLPALKTGPYKGFPRIFAIALDLVSFADGQIDDALLAGYLNAYQTHSPLCDAEISALGVFVQIALIERIRNVCANIRQTLLQWQKAERFFRGMQKSGDSEAEKFFLQYARSEGTDPRFLEHLFYLMRRSEKSFIGIQHIVDEQLASRGTDLAGIIRQEHGDQSKDTVSMGNCIASLRDLGSVDFTALLEAVSFVDEILRRDPGGTYPGMDAQTRALYRKRVEKLADIFGISEYQVAMEAITLSTEACGRTDEQDGDTENFRVRHVGYYLLGKGQNELYARLHSTRVRKPKKMYEWKGLRGTLYFGGIGLFSFLSAYAAAVYAAVAVPDHRWGIAVLAGLATLLPAMEIAIGLANFLASKVVKPKPFFKMDFSLGIPDDMRTFVVMPTLLTKQNVAEVFANLEGQYLRNREKNLLFAVIGAFSDASCAGGVQDKAILHQAMDAVTTLNRKYAKDEDIFYLFHRELRYSAGNNRWFGWERKRGALLEFNDLLLGRTDTSFSHSSCTNPSKLSVRYVITLDGDTILPFGMAKRMVETMAHPLNCPVVNKRKGVVEEGYAILQPRVSVNCESSCKTLFSRIFAGHEGLDPYANAISDVYQDLFGEGIYTGKGIYDLNVFQYLLRDAFPDNSILSHDLLEGCYARAGLATELVLMDSFPVQFNSYAARQHRWVRGDWQLLPYLFGKVRMRNGEKIANPIGALSKWKIADNLRRSVTPASLVLLLFLGFTVLPGKSAVWLSIIAIAVAFPFFAALIEYILSQRYASDRIKRHIPVIAGVKAALLQSFYTFILLAYQAALQLHAALISIHRVLFTRKNLLEWVTMADVERTQRNTQASYWRKMWASPILAVGLIGLTAAFRSTSLFACSPLCILWFCAPQIAFWISRRREDAALALSDNDLCELRKIARRTYRYFEEFANVKNHYLAPDNYQVDPPRGVARRTSPTNIGLGLMAVLSGRDFGYIGTAQMVNALNKTLSTVESLQTWNGHLLNWYDTTTLLPLRPRYVSTVDSGNFVSYLLTLREGLEEYKKRPISEDVQARGLIDTMLCAGKRGEAALAGCAMLKRLQNDGPFDPVIWRKALSELTKELNGRMDSAFLEKAHRSAAEFLREMDEYLPWISLAETMPEGLLCRCPQTALELRDRLMAMMRVNAPICEMVDRIKAMEALIDEFNSIGTEDAAAWLKALRQKLPGAAASFQALVERIDELKRRIDAFSNPDFAALYVQQKKLFSIGYSIEDGKLTNSYYDLLASEARQTSYIAIAKGQVESEHWSRMGRALTTVDGYKGLISWTGTMFEYCMPLLVMRNYENTLLDETYSFMLKSQRKYARQHGTPWGMSESAFNMLDARYEYQYKAFGVPWLGLKRGLSEDVVVAPYATFLALLVDPVEAVQNIGALIAQGLGGAYGLFEAADYTPRRLPFDEKRAIVKCYMAHHQGMSLMALDNCLNGYALQKRFHKNAEMHAARLLLLEKIPSRLLFTKETRQKTAPLLGPSQKEPPKRKFTVPDPILPMAHILSNGSYTVMVTDRGTGYSKTKITSINRWRSDAALDPYGMFFYIRNCTDGEFWSAAYAPLGKMPDGYEAEFSGDKAVFRRKDKNIKTDMEITVADADNAEIRRITLHNAGNETTELEVTSFFEIALNDQAADVAHPAFANLFIETEYEAQQACVIAHRRARSERELGLWLASTAVVEGKQTAQLEFETDRMQFLGRGNGAKSPSQIEHGRPLSGGVGAVLDPAMCLRVKVAVEPGKTAKISFVVAVGESREDVLALIDKYHTMEDIEKAFRLSLTRSRVETGFLNLGAREWELYCRLIRDLLFVSPDRLRRREWILRSFLGQPSLWRLGISGDRATVMVELHGTERMGILREVVKAHEYWRLLDLSVDLVIVCHAEHSYMLPVYERAREIVLARSNGSAMPSDVFFVEKNKLTDQEYLLLHDAASLSFTDGGKNLSEQVLSIPQRLPMKKQKATQTATDGGPNIPEREELLFDNSYGGFAKNGTEYAIRLDTEKNTPLPWVNVVANPDFGFIASEAGSVFTWAYNSQQMKLTPWNNDAVSDPPGEAVYLCDESGAVWTVSAKPVREQGTYTVRHGFGYTVYERHGHGVEATLTYFVPREGTIKLALLRMKNTSGSTKRIAAAYYVQPVLGANAQRTAKTVRTGMGLNGMLLVRNPFNVTFADKVAFLDCSEAGRSVTGDRLEFFGLGGMESPDGLKQDAFSGNVGAGYDPCAAMRVEVPLNPGETRSLVFMLGVSDSAQSANAQASPYRDAAYAELRLSEVKQFWQNALGTVQVHTPSATMNLLQNGWLQYQLISCRLWARSGFYQSGGAYGFRDQLQDCLGVAHSMPEAVRGQILLHARHQFEQGDVQHWWHETSGMGVRTRISDDKLWLPYATAEYVRITGDSSILREQVPFLSSEPLQDGCDERYEKPGNGGSASLYAHCLSAIGASLRFGSHNLPLMGTGDWNDGMNAVGEQGGESVWLGWFLQTVLKTMIPLCNAMGDEQTADMYQNVCDRLSEAIEKHAWDGDWYKRAFFADGTPLGSSANAECKIDSIAQSWAVLSASADTLRAKRAMQSLEDRLVCWEDGIVKLLTPPFDRSELEPGYIKGYVPGVRENGGQYTHAAVWAVIAFAMQGDGDKAFSLYQLINPIERTITAQNCAKYKAEPYVLAADVYSRHPHAGRGGWTWYTGSAGWMYRAGLESILGLRKNGDTLVVDPCIPKNWEGYEAEYRYCESVYHIRVNNPSGLNRGIKSLMVDGTAFSGNTMRLHNDGKRHEVIVIMGQNS